MSKFLTGWVINAPNFCIVQGSIVYSCEAVIRANDATKQWRVALNTRHFGSPHVFNRVSHSSLLCHIPAPWSHEILCGWWGGWCVHCIWCFVAHLLSYICRKMGSLIRWHLSRRPQKEQQFCFDFEGVQYNVHCHSECKSKFRINVYPLESSLAPSGAMGNALM